MRTSDFDYALPPELIAQTPVEPRDYSRLLVLDRATGRIQHRRFTQILDYLRPGDVMVFNQSRVIPARIRGRRQGTGGRVQLLLLRRESPGLWQALGQPGRSLRPGSIIEVESSKSPQTPLGKGRTVVAPSGKGGTDEVLQVEVIASGEGGIKTVRLSSEADILRLGEMPLPPYIHRRLEEPERYQTVYARETGSAAAPTAGLHFTQPLMDRLKDAGVELVFLTLHVGLDTFRPLQGDDPREHQIHTEYYELGEQAADTLNRARGEGRRIIAVGTTSVRVLEQVALLATEGDANRLIAARGQAGLFILPGYRFQVVDAMITNFHLPRSTLLMLVSAFAGSDPSTSSGQAPSTSSGQAPSTSSGQAPSTSSGQAPSTSSGQAPSTSSGRDMVLAAYREAMEQRYRFYSFGDAMLIL